MFLFLFLYDLNFLNELCNSTSPFLCVSAIPITGTRLTFWHIYYVPKCRCLAKISICDPNFVSWVFLVKIMGYSAFRPV